MLSLRIALLLINLSWRSRVQEGIYVPEEVLSTCLVPGV
jgi:hypothetical protein